jgi:hypothetical protein
MPKSRHRKNQKKKSQNRTVRLQAEKKKRMEEYLKELQNSQSPPTSPETPYNPNEMKNPYNLGT